MLTSTEDNKVLVVKVTKRSNVTQQVVSSSGRALLTLNNIDYCYKRERENRRERERERDFFSDW